MKRIDTATKETDKFGSGKHGFTNGVPGVTPTTDLDETWFDHAQEEIARTIEHTGASLDSDRFDQLKRAIVGMNQAAGASDWTDSPAGSISAQLRGAAGRGRGADGLITERWVAVGLGGAKASSNDGKTWTDRSSGVHELYGVTRSEALSLFCAVGEDASGGGNPEILTSPDGITYTSRTPAGSDIFRDVVWYGGGSVFVAVGLSTAIETSPDGITWTARSAPGGSGGSALASVAASDSLVMAVGASGLVITSPDGITWTLRTATGAGTLQGVAHDPDLDRWVVVGDSGAIFYSDDDGDTWTSSKPASLTRLLVDIVHDGVGLFVAVGDARIANHNTQILTSPDGVNWTEHPSATEEDLKGVAYSAGRYVSVGANGALQHSAKTGS